MSVEEEDSRCVLAKRRKLDLVIALNDLAIVLVGNAKHNTGTVAGQIIARAGASMRHALSDGTGIVEKLHRWNGRGGAG